MRNVFIIHGLMGHPKENWIPWLKTELEKLGCNVIVPQFPTPEDQTLDNWLKVLEPYKDLLNEDAIMIGHSLGCSFVLNVLERQEWPIRAAFLVAGFVGLLNIGTIDPLIGTFTVRHFDWEKIRRNARHIEIFTSDNDPYVPKEKADYLGRELHIEPTVVLGAGHFNTRTGYQTFGLLLDDIRAILDQKES